MAKSKIINFLLLLWHKIVTFYDASLIARGIGGALDFFKNRADGSFFVRLFKHGAFGGKSFENSLTSKAIKGIMVPKKAILKGKSRIAEFILNLVNIPLYVIGLILICYSLPMLAIEFIGASTSFEIVVSLALLALGTVCILLNRTPYEIFSGSFFLKLVGGFFNESNKEHRTVKVKIVPVLAVSLAMGIIGGIISPVLVTLSVFAVLFSVLVIARFEIGVMLILLLSAFLPTALIAGLTVLTFVGFIAALYSKRLKSINLSRVFPLIFIYLVFAAIATVTSPKMSSSAFVFIVYLVFILAYLMIVNTLTTKSRWKGFLTVFLVGAFFVSLIGIYQNFFLDATTQSWVDKEMFEEISTRVYATFDNPNVLGQYFIITIPLIFSMFVIETKPWQKTVWGFLLASAVLCLLYTWSRGAWVGVMLGIVVFLLLRDRRWIALGILGLVMLPFVLPASIMNRLLSIGNLGDSSTAYRVSVWIASARMALDFWQLGVGYGSDAFRSVYSIYALNGANFALHAHNFYIQLVVDVGIVGLISYLLIVTSALRDLTFIKKDKLMKAVGFAFAGVILGYMFQGIAESLWYNMKMSLMFWIAIAFIESAYNIEKGDLTND